LKDLKLFLEISNMGRKKIITLSQPYGVWDKRKKDWQTVYKDVKVEIDLDKPHTEITESTDEIKVKTAERDQYGFGRNVKITTPYGHETPPSKNLGSLKEKGVRYTMKEYTISKKYIKGDNGQKYGSGESCFIATAVYGDMESPQVEILRKLRDQKLAKTKLGKKAIKFYYSGFGKKAAKYIQENFPSSIPVIRKGLDYLVKKYGNMQA
jgi:hypothetical protein